MSDCEREGSLVVSFLSVLITYPTCSPINPSAKPASQLLSCRAQYQHDGNKRDRDPYIDSKQRSSFNEDEFRDIEYGLRSGVSNCVPIGRISRFAHTYSNQTRREKDRAQQSNELHILAVALRSSRDARLQADVALLDQIV